ncbi:F-box/kelch-repeat protein At3g06240-like [Tripterygium wilfordii]|uniref:F-box/kelch-repeat protein At3g06240-like n=1 Tax=Tripterygium wilfordii TaxID=458696 RepID=UPI0018F8074A|nr:F-box/kelch-repeat protein At3g06240-like [Tripterygium wilfordii]
MTLGRRLSLGIQPRTRELKHPPLSPMERLPGADSDYYDDCGFGFDRNTNDYKVLKFVTNHFPDEEEFVERIELYSLNSDSWREIPSVYGCLTHNDSFDTHNNGIYYWWVDDLDSHAIMSFDFAIETFEKFSLLDYERGNREIYCLVMMEHGVMESWVKQVNIGPILSVKMPLGWILQEWQNVFGSL